MSIRGGSATGPELLKFERPYRFRFNNIILYVLQFSLDFLATLHLIISIKNYGLDICIRNDG